MRGLDGPGVRGTASGSSRVKLSWSFAVSIDAMFMVQLVCIPTYYFARFCFEYGVWEVPSRHRALSKRCCLSHLYAYALMRSQVGDLATPTKWRPIQTLTVALDTLPFL